MKDFWVLDRALVDSGASTQLSSLDTVLGLSGERVTASPISELIYLKIDGVGYYVKRYFQRGKALRRWLGRSRVRAEWENLLFFKRSGLTIPPLVAYGASGQKGAIVTREVPGAVDLQTLAQQQPELLRNRYWLDCVVGQVACAARRLHEQGFAHNDFKWRNILVTTGEEPEVFFIDCPTGEHWWGPLLAYRKIKDLACLDKVAKHELSRTQRLRFYLSYVGSPSLSDRDKKQIRRTLAFFEGRE
ncbi:MAG: lipopolysaccharide kinase InaA family protein [Porticoccaceae bacterium]